MKRKASATMAAMLAVGLAATAFGMGATNGTDPRRFVPGPLVGAAPPAPGMQAMVTIDDGPGWAFEPTVAINPSDPAHLVAAAMKGYNDSLNVQQWWLTTYVSKDGGLTWSAAPLPGGMAAGPTHPLFAAGQIADPVLRFLADGTVLLAGFAADWKVKEDLPIAAGVLRAADVFVARSTDGGATWPDIRILRYGAGAEAAVWLRDNRDVVADAPVTPVFNDKPWLAAGSDGSVLLVWSDVQFPAIDSSLLLFGGDLWFSTSDDSGVTWTEPMLLVDGAVYPGLPAVLANGGLRVAFNDFLSGNWVLASSDDVGETWSFQTAVPQSQVGQRFSYVGSGLQVQNLSTHERLLMAFAAEGPGQTQVPMLAASDDGGQTWAAPMALDDPTGAGDHPRSTPIPFPSATTTDLNGNVFVSFYHVPPGELVATYRIVTVRDGVVSPPLVLDQNLPRWPGYRGHYQGLAALEEGAFVAWVTGPGPADAYDLVGAYVTPG